MSNIWDFMPDEPGGEAIFVFDDDETGDYIVVHATRWDTEEEAAGYVEGVIEEFESETEH